MHEYDKVSVFERSEVILGVIKSRLQEYDLPKDVIQEVLEMAEDYARSEFMRQQFD
jgi:hypothetical protein